MSRIRYSLAPSGALTLRQTPEYSLAEAVTRALSRLKAGVPCRKRRTELTEAMMHPDPHNFIATPANGSILNAGAFGSAFAPHPCGGCAKEHHAYDAQEPQRPQRNLKQAVSALFARAPK